MSASIFCAKKAGNVGLKFEGHLKDLSLSPLSLARINQRNVFAFESGPRNVENNKDRINTHRTITKERVDWCSYITKYQDIYKRS